jgi:hypothetical protein
MPHYVVECTPKIKHIYGKRVMYAAASAYSPGFLSNMATDYYDRQMVLWKGWLESRCTGYVREEPFPFWKIQSMYDLQAGHTTHIQMALTPNLGTKPESLTLKALIARGR